MPRAARKTDYLFHKNNSPNWCIRLQQDGKDRIKSLGTSNRIEAEVRALPIIAQHKAALLALQPRYKEQWQHTLEPGREHSALAVAADETTTITPPAECAKIIATDRELIYMGHNGAIIRTEPNGSAVKCVADPNPTLTRIPAKVEFALFDQIERPKVATKNGDDALFEAYLDHGARKGKGLEDYPRREAQAMWELFKSLAEGKALKDCTRDDGRKVVAHLEAQGLKSASIRKKVKWLTSAINHAINEGKLTFNPFKSVVVKRDDALERKSLDDNDMAACKANLGKLSASDQLMFRLLACTGLRLGEAFQIKAEKVEQGVRYVSIGTKTEASKRDVPLPAEVLPLPKITGKLFAGNANDASKRLCNFLRDCGITDPAKVVHSLRHRAITRLRIAKVDPDLRRELLGHAGGKSEHESYGMFPMTDKREAIDKIGF